VLDRLQSTSNSSFNMRCASTAREATTPSRCSSAPATIRSLNRALVTASTRAWPVTQSLKAVLFIAVMPFVSRCPAQPSQPRRFLMLHPLEHVRDHQHPLAHTPALAPCQAPQLRRPGSLRKKYAGIAYPPNKWYPWLITLPHLGIPGSRSYYHFVATDSERDMSATKLSDNRTSLFFDMG
jgi:hypothetical protein